MVMKMMKRISLAFLFLFFVLFTASIVFAANITEDAVLVGDNLVMFDVKQEIPNVPVGISARTAYQLVTGKIPEVRIADEKGKKITYIFGFPLKAKIITREKVVSFEKDTRKWNIKPVIKVESNLDWLTTIFCLVIPFAGILIFSFKNQILKIGDRKLLISYFILLVGTLVGSSVGVLVGGLSKVLGIFAGLFVGMLAGEFAGGFTGMLAGAFAGGCAGMFVGWFVVMFIGRFVDWGEIIFYLIFLISAMTISFGVAKVANYYLKIKNLVLEK